MGLVRLRHRGCAAELLSIRVAMQLRHAPRQHIGRCFILGVCRLGPVTRDLWLFCFLACSFLRIQGVRECDVARKTEISKALLRLASLLRAGFCATLPGRHLQVMVVRCWLAAGCGAGRGGGENDADEPFARGTRSACYRRSPLPQRETEEFGIFRFGCCG